MKVNLSKNKSELIFFLLLILTVLIAFSASIGKVNLAENISKVFLIFFGIGIVIYCKTDD